MGYLEPYLEIMNQWGETEIRSANVSRVGRGAPVDAEIQYRTPAGNTLYAAQLRAHFRSERLVWPRGRTMDMTGFEHVFERAEMIELAEGVRWPVVTIPVFLLLKWIRPPYLFKPA